LVNAFVVAQVDEFGVLRPILVGKPYIRRIDDVVALLFDTRRGDYVNRTVVSGHGGRASLLAAGVTSLNAMAQVLPLPSPTQKPGSLQED
jgi:L-arabinose isomerase